MVRAIRINKMENLDCKFCKYFSFGLQNTENLIECFHPKNLSYTEKSTKEKVEIVKLFLCKSKWFERKEYE